VTPTAHTDLEFRRLQWRCRRGLLELDLLLQDFLQLGYKQLATQEKVDFLQLLELPDNVLLDYLHMKEVPHEENLRNIIKKIL